MKQYVFVGDWPEDDAGIFDRTHLQFMTHKRLARWADDAGLVLDRWFPRPDPQHPRAMQVLRVVNSILLGSLSHVLDYQVQARFRRTDSGKRGES